MSPHSRAMRMLAKPRPRRSRDNPGEQLRMRDTREQAPQEAGMNHKDGQTGSNGEEERA